MPGHKVGVEVGKKIELLHTALESPQNELSNLKRKCITELRKL